jgi:hypothetical protein
LLPWHFAIRFADDILLTLTEWRGFRNSSQRLPASSVIVMTLHDIVVSKASDIGTDRTA